MKVKKVGVCLSGLACILMLAGCQADTKSQESLPAGGEDRSAEESTLQDGTGGGLDSSEEENRAVSGENTVSTAGKESDGAEVFTWQLRIVDGAETGNLVLAGEDSGSVYTLFLGTKRDGTASEIPVFLDGQPADWTALEDGMMVELSFDFVLETFPGQFGNIYSIDAYSLGTERNPGGSYYDLCGLYLQVLDDLWEKDPGLNGGIENISVDLSEAPGGLTQGEKDAVAWVFGCKQGVMALTMTMEELAQQGYLTDVGNGSKLYQWEDGILFSITAVEQEGNYSLPVLEFNAEKWRSPLGAYFFGNCTAVWPEMGTWNGYEIGMEAIS